VENGVRVKWSGWANALVMGFGSGLGTCGAVAQLLEARFVAGG
jgi:hypothetical protein